MHLWCTNHQIYAIEKLKTGPGRPRFYPALSIAFPRARGEVRRGRRQWRKIRPTVNVCTSTFLSRRFLLAIGLRGYSRARRIRVPTPPCDFDRDADVSEETNGNLHVGVFGIVAVWEQTERRVERYVYNTRRLRLRNISKPNRALSAYPGRCV